MPEKLSCAGYLQLEYPATEPQEKNIQANRYSKERETPILNL